jgi:hypothetical protein
MKAPEKFTRTQMLANQDEFTRAFDGGEDDDDVNVAERAVQAAAAAGGLPTQQPAPADAADGADKTDKTKAGK